MVVPSRAESLPYIVLEAAAAAVPLIATNVGGIPEIFGPQSARLVPPGDAAALAQRDRAPRSPTRAALRNETLTLRARVQAEFSADVMTDGVLAAYARGARASSRRAMQHYRTPKHFLNLLRYLTARRCRRQSRGTPVGRGVR